VIKRINAGREKGLTAKDADQYSFWAFPREIGRTPSPPAPRCVEKYQNDERQQFKMPSQSPS
jgi:hypothetical protein